jgi:hypothetical protein
MGRVMYRLGTLSFFCPQEETDDIFSDNIYGTWLLPLYESWFEDDGESWVGWVASTIKPPTQILLKHFFPVFTAVFL